MSGSYKISSKIAIRLLLDSAISSESRTAIVSRCDLFGNRLGLEKQQQVIRTARLRIGAGEIESTEGMRADHRPRAFPVDVKIPHEKVLPSLPDVLRIVRKDGPGEPVLGIIGHLQRVLEVFRFGNREHWTEDLFLKDFRVGAHVSDNGRRDEIAGSGGGRSTCDQPSLA